MKVFTGIAILALSTVLSGDRCTYPPRLIAQANSGSNSLPLLYQAAKQAPESALPLLLGQLVEKQHAYWLTQTLALLNVNQAYQLVMSVHDAVLRKNLLHELASRGHQSSQFQHALLVKDPDKRLRYLVKLAEQGHTEAIVSSYYLAESREADSIASTWLAKAAKIEPDLTLKYADLLWRTQSAQAALDYLSKEDFDDNQEVQATIAMIQQTSFLTERGSHSLPLQDNCHLSLQIVASTIAGIEKALNIAQTYRNDPRFSNFPVCINQPLWLDFTELNCSNEPNTRLNCSVEPLIALAQELTFTHMLIIGQHGVANVHNGMMYLDLRDDYQVFVHEFAHFAGFVDEYPLSASLAGQFCTQPNAPNLVFENDAPDINSTHFASYLKTPSHLQLTETRTCENTPRRAFKPVAETTFMEHHDVGSVPDVYLNIWRDTLTQPGSLTPVFVNFAQWSDARGDTVSAQYWWQKYNQYQL